MDQFQRREIVEHREAEDANGSSGSLDIHNRMNVCLSISISLIQLLAAFRALVEENIKANVRRIAKSDLITGVCLFLRHLCAIV